MTNEEKTYYVYVESIGFDENKRLLLSADGVDKYFLSVILEKYGNAANKIQIRRMENEE